MRDGRLSASNVKDQPKWEIKTRTLEHAPDGSPDSRENVGIGEWVELRVVPETIANVEWIIKGGSILSNRFGNPSILIMGGDAGKLSMSVKVHDAPHTASPAFKKHPPQNKWRRLESELQVLETLADKPSAFEAQCNMIDFDAHLYEGLAEARSQSTRRLTRLLNDISALSRRAPGANSWIRIQTSVLESASLRLGVCLDSNADKSKLEKDFWDLLHACTITLECQYKQFKQARSNASNPVENKKPPVVRGDYERSEYIGLKGPRAVASAFSGSLPKLRYLLYVQVLNALPGATSEQQRKALIQHGFSKKEADLLLSDLDCHFKS
jgi:hypothetical protein